MVRPGILLILLLPVATGCGAASELGDRDNPAGDARDEPVAIAGADTARCVEHYDRTTLKNRAFAFDGTVDSIAWSADDANDPESPAHVYADVTFKVNEWFRGDGPSEITVAMFRPDVVTSVDDATYDMGSRLLVSGQPRWDGEPLDAPVAWACGFTRTHTEDAADFWREALSDGAD